jgi:hypothetical protein
MLGINWLKSNVLEINRAMKMNISNMGININNHAIGSNPFLQRTLIIHVQTNTYKSLIMNMPVVRDG